MSNATEFCEGIARKWREAEERTNALIRMKRDEKIKKDEEFARRIQNEEFGSTSSSSRSTSSRSRTTPAIPSIPTTTFRRTPSTIGRSSSSSSNVPTEPPRLDIGSDSGGNHSWKLVPAIKGAAFCAACPKLEMLPTSLNNTYLVQSTQFRIWPPKGLWIRGKSESYEVWCACERVPSAAFRSSYSPTDDVVVTSEGRVYKLFKRQSSATVGRKIIFPSNAGRILVFVRAIPRTSSSRTQLRRPFLGGNSTTSSLLEAADRQMESINELLNGLGTRRRSRWQ